MADQITALPTPPSTSDPANFDARADAFLAALPDFATELNEFGASLNSLSTTTTSVSSVAIGTGTKNFTVETGKSLFVGMSYRMAYDANNWMNGEIISYDSGTGALSLDVDAARGSGTYAAWVGTLSFNGQIETEQLSDGVLSADAAGRGKMADQFLTPAKFSDDAFVVTLGASHNLIIANNTATPNSQVDIDADEIVLKDSNRRAYLATSVNLTVDITASGANGLDTGSEASSTWYYLWVIYNGTTVAGLISASSTAPTLPSGYTYKALVGAIYNASSSNFVATCQVGRTAFIAPINVLNEGAATSYTSVSLSSAVPPIAKVALGRHRLNTNSSTAQRADIASNTSDLGICSVGGGSATGVTVFYSRWKLPLPTAQTIYYKVTGQNTTVEVCGWEI